MAWLLINGHEYGVQSGTGSSTKSKTRARVRVGEVARAYDGTLRSTVRAYKHQWGPLDLMPLTEDEYAQLITDIGLGIVPVEGPIFGVGAIQADVQITDETYYRDESQPNQFDYLVTITIDEV